MRIFALSGCSNSGKYEFARTISGATTPILIQHDRQESISYCVAILFGWDLDAVKRGDDLFSRIPFAANNHTAYGIIQDLVRELDLRANPAATGFSVPDLTRTTTTRCFSDAIKCVCAALMGESYDRFAVDEPFDYNPAYTPKRLMARVRNYFCNLDSNFWVSVLVRNLSGDLVVVPDVDYEHEYLALKNLGAACIVIYKDSSELIRNTLLPDIEWRFLQFSKDSIYICNTNPRDLHDAAVIFKNQK